VETKNFRFKVTKIIYKNANFKPVNVFVKEFEVVLLSQSVLDCSNKEALSSGSNSCLIQLSVLAKTEGGGEGERCLFKAPEVEVEFNVDNE